MRGVLIALLVALLPVGPGALAGAPPESPHARFARAGRLMDAGQLEKAYAILEKLAQDYPQRWGERARRKMTEIKKIGEARERVRAEAARLREAAGAAHGELGPWLLVESANLLFEARLYSEALKDAGAAAGKQKSRFRPAALLLVARCHAKLGAAADARKAYRLVLDERGVGRAERGAAWAELADLLSSAGKSPELRALLEAHIKRGPEEPGARKAVDAYIAASLVGEKESLRAGKVLYGLVKGWPPGELSPEWVLVAAKVAEFIDRDYSRADKLYRLVLERYPQACFDLTMIRVGRRGYDAGRTVILAAITRVEKKKKGEIKPLKAPRAKERGKSPEHALAAVLCALRGGDLATARSCATGKLLGELRTKRYPFRRYGLSDYHVEKSGETAPGEARVTYQVSGELGVTRVLEKKATVVREGKVWKVSDLGM
jgi:hypothetical protein